MDQNNNGYFPQNGQQVPQQPPQQGYNYGAQQQVPQQGYNYGAQQQVPQQMNYGGGYGYAPVPQQSSSNGKTIGIIAGVVGAIALVVVLFIFLGGSSGGSLDKDIVGTWTSSLETVTFKSDKTFSVSSNGIEFGGTWEINADKDLVLYATAYGISQTLTYKWSDPSQSSGTWCLSNSTLYIEGDQYTKN